MSDAWTVPADIAAWERHIHAFVAFSHPEERRLPTGEGSLSGLTVGVKDIIDVAGLPTRNGSACCADAAPARADAGAVSALRAAGARIVGKTVTTEFAFTDPTACRNPYDLARTPGGSSSGSGAAVAAGLVDLALGTQTAGSLCRPAAYCGVVGLKPTCGLVSTEGVTPLSPSFDAVGVIARSVGVARAALLAMAAPDKAPPTDQPCLARALLPTETVAAPETLDAWQSAAIALEEPPELSLQLDVGRIVAAHRQVMQAEAAQAHAGFLASDLIGALQPRFRAGLVEGSRAAPEGLAEARATLAQAQSDFWHQLADIDVVLTLPVPDGAPLIDGTTGFQDWLTPWTVFGGPLVSLPWGVDSLGRPRAVMLAGRPGADLALLAMAARLERRAPQMPRPVIPQR